MNGLFNRRATIEILEKYASLSIRLQKPMTLCFTDMDGLKHINDTYGHQEGDDANQGFSKVITLSIRESD